MKNIATRLSIGARLISWLLLVSVGAYPQVVDHLRTLVSDSDVVAVAKVVAVNQTGSGKIEIPNGQSIPAHFRVAVLHLSDVLKGSPGAADILVRYTILYSPGGWAGGVPRGYTLRDTLIPNSTRLIFLKGSGDHYEFADGSHLAIVCAPEPANDEQSTDTFGRVVSRISEAMFSPNVSQQDKEEAIRQLGAVDTDSVIPDLRRFVASNAGSENEFLRTAALVALLAHKDESVVGMAESDLMSGSSAYWKESLLDALTRALPPSRSIPILAEALTLSNPHMRASAAISIEQTNSPIGIPPLLRAVDDPDPEVAFQVMQGLGNLTEEYDWRPKSLEPDVDWFRCLNHWRESRQQFTGSTTGHCKKIEIEQSDDAYPATAETKAQYALAVISSDEYLKTDPQCVQVAMRYLGTRHVKEAIPRLVALLGYHQEVFGRKPSKDQEYPAIVGLIAMGELAAPALVSVIGSETDETKSTNALFALIDIFRGKPEIIIRKLTDAAEHNPDRTAADRLLRAVDQVRSSPFCGQAMCP